MYRSEYNIEATVWLYPGHAGWHFVDIPLKISAEIKELFGVDERGWGSLPVICKIGKTEWKTSIFWNSKTKTYLLALKADVRKKEDIYVDKKVNILVKII